MPWRKRARPSPVEGLVFISEEEMMNRVIKAKAWIALLGKQTVTLRTKEGNFEITPQLAKKLLREDKPRKRKHNP